MLDIAAEKILPGTANNYISNNMPMNSSANSVGLSILSVANWLEELVYEMG